MDDYRMIPLPGSESYVRSYERGEAWERMWPGNDCVNLAYAIEYNDAAPLAGKTITNISMIEQGLRDEKDWQWWVTLDDGSIWQATGGCDYTGWDCRSWLEWSAF